MVDLKSIWALQKPSENEVIIKTKIDVLPQFRCYAATNHITGNHLYVMTLSSHTIIPEFKNLRFKGVRIEVFDLTENKELNIYLIDNKLKDIFSMFIENIIDDIIDCSTENEAITRTSNVIQNWKKLFDKINIQGLTVEQQKGLIGELLFIDELIKSNLNPDYILNCWTGPDFEDKDFTFGTIGIEIKFTSSKLPRIKITSERQLDTTNISKLFLTIYSSESVKENGVSLNSLINSIRKKVASNSATLKFFNERLETVGYFEEDKENYNSQYGVKSKSMYEVNETFPRLTINNLPQGVHNTSYFIENSAIENHKSEFNSILKELKNE